MNLLYKLRKEEYSTKDQRRISPLKAWLCTHAHSSLEKFQQLELAGYNQPLIFQAESPMRRFVAYIDHENRFSIEDKLSQVCNRIIYIHTFYHIFYIYILFSYNMLYKKIIVIDLVMKNLKYTTP